MTISLLPRARITQTLPARWEMGEDVSEIFFEFPIAGLPNLCEQPHGTWISIINASSGISAEDCLQSQHVNAFPLTYSWQQTIARSLPIHIRHTHKNSTKKARTAFISKAAAAAAQVSWQQQQQQQHQPRKYIPSSESQSLSLTPASLAHQWEEKKSKNARAAAAAAAALGSESSGYTARYSSIYRGGGVKRLPRSAREGGGNRRLLTRGCISSKQPFVYYFFFYAAQ